MFDKENLHHAYCIEGEKGEAYEKLCVFFEEEMHVKTRGNPDFSYIEFETLSIEEGRGLKEKQQNRSLDGGRKIFVVSVNSITREAQNSLLKIFEEPTAGTHFFLLMPSGESLLPTLKSRLQMIKLAGSKQSAEVKSEKEKEIEAFLKASKSERLLLLKTIIEEKNREKALDFLQRLESRLAENVGGKMKKEQIRTLEEIIKMKQYVGDRGSSVKMILEHVALTI